MHEGGPNQSAVLQYITPCNTFHVSKVFERRIVKQVEEHIEPYLSILLCGFRKGYNTQQALVRFLEKTKLCIDVGGKVGAVMMDLSKAFDCLRHDLLIAKLHAYGFSHDALSLIYSYLHNRQQKVKINAVWSMGLLAHGSDLL